MSSSPTLLDGNSLTVDQLFALSTGDVKIGLTPDAWAKVTEGRQVVDGILAEKKVAYGINTGFGLFSNVVIAPEKLEVLQENLIRSHAAGVGTPLTLERTRMLLALRINVLAKGHSGITVETLKQAVDAFNNDCISVVPEQGTVGASGDLAPLSHLALGLLGEGKMWNAKDPSRPPFIDDAATVLASAGLQPVKLKAKEGLALINGTQMIAALGTEAVCRARNLASCADVVCALTLEGLKGTFNAFHPCIHAVRPHRGQGMVAARLRACLNPGKPSELYQSHKYCGRVQDAYSLRCAPQVHGIVHDTISFVESILDVELNSATDNPMVFAGNPEVQLETTTGERFHWPPKRASSSLSLADESPQIPNVADITDIDEAKREIERLRALVGEKKPAGESQTKKASSTLYRGAESVGGFVISGGNFHGEYPAKALDYLAIGVHEVASISERRMERLVNPTLSNLPAFLVADGGLNSGFMIAHCTAAALVSENKVLTHPSSVDSISTSAAKEDHVSMGGFSARKALQVVANVEKVIAIELLAACQALEFHRPLKSTPVLEEVHKLVREKVAAWDQDRIMHSDIDAVVELIRSGKIWETAQAYLAPYPGTCC